jgi:pimeloyl-[acyl-carrier protein] methyl ester esterase
MQNESALTLILLPGMDGTGELFENLLAELPPNLKTVVVRYPTYTVLNYEELTTLAQMQIPKNTPYILLGESFSGPVAIALAASANEQLKGVILSCTFATSPSPLLSYWSFLIPEITISGQLFSIVSKLLMGNFQNEKVYEQLKAVLPKASPSTMRARLDAMLGVNYLEKLTKINVPILYLRAKQDHLVASSASKAIVKHAKNVSLVELDAPHLLLQIAAKKAAHEISGFIQHLLKN